MRAPSVVVLLVIGLVAQPHDSSAQFFPGSNGSALKRVDAFDAKATISLWGGDLEDHHEREPFHVGARAGVVVEVKPELYGGSPTSFAGPALGVEFLSGRAKSARYGLGVTFSKYSDDLLFDRQSVEVLGIYRWPAGGARFLQFEAGLSHLQWKLETSSWVNGSPTATYVRDFSSADVLLGPVLGWSNSSGAGVTVELRVAAQLRWSPDYNDFLRVGISGAVGLGGA